MPSDAELASWALSDPLVRWVLSELGGRVIGVRVVDQRVDNDVVMGDSGLENQ